MRKRLRNFRLPFSINPIRGLRYLWNRLGNWRRGRVQNFDYILLTLPTAMPALPEARPWFRRRIQADPPMSLTDLDKHFQQIGDDPRPKGVILHFRGMAMSLADMQTLRASILRLRDKGKRVIAYAPTYDNASYYVASACDEIILQPGGMVSTLGLVSQPTFLQDALETVGVKFNSVAISPFKGAFDNLTRNTISHEGREQLDWLLDSRYEMLLSGMAEGRDMTLEGVRTMIDTAPHLDSTALERGYVDAVLHEEGLAKHLNTEHLVLWDNAKKVLLRKWQKRFDKYVAVLPLTGMIMPGESASPPVDIPLPFLGASRLGDLTVVRQVRNLLKNKRAAAVVLWIDSPGGAAIAADAMTSALRELAKDRPVVVYMNGVAASGGYYVATPAQWIVAQPGTITGSIGVILGKPVTDGLFEKLKVNRMQFTRGANAAIFTDLAPFDDIQRGQMHQNIEHIYRQFIDYVAESRNMTPEAVDIAGGGRVWTGQQALEHHLVDQLGDLQAALDKARELADLPDDAPAGIVQGKGKPMIPQLAEEANPAALLAYMHDNLQHMSGLAQVLLPMDLE